MDPPDDPGGGVPEPACHVTIDESTMDTDCSIDHSKSRKRSNFRRVCKKCNKKRRKRSPSDHPNQPLKETDCLCEDNHNIKTYFESTPTTLFVSPQVTILPTTNPDISTSSNDQNELSSQITNPFARLYQALDAAPYVVHIQKEPNENNNNITLHPVSFGRFLQKSKFNGIVDGSLKKIGRNRLSLSFSDYVNANEFISSNSVKLNNYKAFVPIFNITRMGVVKGVPCDWSSEEIINNIKTPIGTGKILKARRIRRKEIYNGQTEYKDTESVVITFDGQILPKRIFICYNALPVELYIYPTIQCYQCCRFGHMKTQCRSKPRCYKCGLDHTGDKCVIDEVTCVTCNGSHSAIDRKCPEYERQKAIKRTMAQNCISYAEATKYHPIVKKLYSEILSTQPQSPTHLYNHHNSVNTNTTTSYKKTFFIKSHTPLKQNKGYDRSTHESIIKDYNPSSPNNGTAINYDNKTSSDMTWLELMKLLSPVCQPNLHVPSNVASILVSLAKTISSNGQPKPIDPVELS